MKRILLLLTSVMLCAATLHSATADPAVSPQTNYGDELHAAVTDMPDIIDMSHADPRTWHTLPSAAQVYGRSLARDPGSEEVAFSDSLQQAILAGQPNSTNRMICSVASAAFPRAR
jgi:hypothetical protein